VRLVREQDVVAQELYDRGLSEDWGRMESVLGLTGQVCLAFLDNNVLDTLEITSSVERPDPGAIQAA
jgi:hypothetical protein